MIVNKSKKVDNLSIINLLVCPEQEQFIYYLKCNNSDNLPFKTFTYNIIYLPSAQHYHNLVPFLVPPWSTEERGGGQQIGILFQRNLQISQKGLDCSVC